MQTGVTPMYFATKNDHPRLVELLLAHGADINKVHAALCYGNIIKMYAVKQHISS